MVNSPRDNGDVPMDKPAHDALGKNLDDELQAWQESLERTVCAHFAEARQRVDPVYRAHFADLGSVYRRHWRHRGDIPRDLVNIPRSLWRLLAQGGRAITRARPVAAPTASRLSKKEQAIARILIEELLQLPQLEQLLLVHIQQHPLATEEHWRELQQLLAQHSPEQARRRLNQALTRLTAAQEGSRDMMLFLALGMLGRSFGDKIAFGSAMGLGSAAATSVYIGQQSFWGSLWVQWFGAPGWVAATGAAGGILAVILVTPLIAPLTEYGINRVRAKKFLFESVDRVERNILHTRADAGSVVGQMGSFIQLLPELLQLLRGLK